MSPYSYEKCIRSLKIEYNIAYTIPIPPIQTVHNTMYTIIVNSSIYKPLLSVSFAYTAAFDLRKMRG